MLIVLARLKLKEGMPGAFVEVAQRLVAASRSEPGCLAYELLQEGPLQFSFLERYADEDAAQAHRKTEHFKTLGRKLGEFMDGRPDVIRLTVVDDEGQS